MKLSTPQFQLLTSLVAGPRPVEDYFPPAKILVRAGFAEWVTTKQSRSLLKITHEGRKRLM